MRTHYNICYGEAGGEKLLLDLFLPDGENFSVFVYFHGGSLEFGDKTSGATPFAQYLTDRNIAVASVEYRKYPTAKYPDFIEDCALSVAWIKQNIASYGASDRIFVGGSSAGGYLSMMLCFDNRWYQKVGVDPLSITGYLHDAGQPTNHFNVLRERGIDSRRVMIDDSAPLYHVGEAESYPPMRFIVADNDMKGRYEQTMLMLTTLDHFGYDQNKISHVVMHGTHCSYDGQIDSDGTPVFGKLIHDFITAN